MSHNRPRTSLLNLFDPLNSLNAVATRDAPSPESDKENSNPTMGDLTMVFSRAYGTPQPTAPSLTRRLVDVGDATIDEILDPLPKDDFAPEEDDDFGIDEDDENATLTFRAMATCLSPKSPEQKDSPAFARSIMRAPLAELILDEDITPIARNKTYKRHIPPPSPIVAFNAASSPNSSMNGSALTTLVNEVNSSGVNFGRLGHQTPEAPEIRISLADDTTPSIAQLNLGSSRQGMCENPALLSVADTTEFSALPQHHRLRTGVQLAGSAHPNRTSVDLNSSFHIHLQSPETSFDLLNDKISFFAPGSGMGSVLDAFDESFELDVEVAKMGAMLRKMSKQEPDEAVVDSPPPDNMAHACSATQDESNPNTSKSAPNPSGSVQPRVGRASSSNPFPSIAEEPSPPIVPDPSNSVQPTAAAPDPQQQDAVLSTPLSTRGVHVAPPPPPVPALRIVKRAKLFGFSKPQPSQDSASGSSFPPTRLSVAPQLIENTKAIPSQGLAPSNSGPRRVLINGGAQKLPPPRENPSALKQMSETTAKRVSGPGAPTLVKQTSSSGLRLPTKFTASTFTSTLPRLSSALPKPQIPVHESSKSKASSSLPSRRLSVKRLVSERGQ